MSTEPRCIEVVITADNAEWMHAWARSLVEDRIAACVHRIEGIRAVYRWEGEIHDDQQVRIAIHTQEARFPDILQRAEQDHPDDVPCVIALPITAGQPEYLKWVVRETSQ